MTPTELVLFRTVLQVRQAELEALLRGREVIAVDSSADMLDQIQHALERDMAISNLERGSARMREVRGAIRRIDLGTFGTCLDCEEEISSKRLAAVPWTTSCLACREAVDRARLPVPNQIEEPLLTSPS